MAKKKSEDKTVEEKAAEVVTSAAPAKPKATSSTPVVENASKEAPVMTFDRFFTTTGKPGHHKIGMVAWLKKRGGLQSKRTLASWQELFANY